MKIAIYSVLNLRNGGGAERWIEQVATRLKGYGHNISVITTRHGEINDSIVIDRLNKNGIDIFEYDNYERIVRVPKVTCYSKISKSLKDVDVLYFNNAFAMNEVLISYLKKNLNLKVVAGYHGTLPEIGNPVRRLYHNTIRRYLSKLFDAHHVLNNYRVKLLDSWGYRNIYMIPNGVDTDIIKPTRKSQVFTVIFAGAMTKVKGIDLFAEIVKLINRSPRAREEIRFIIFGSGPLSYIPYSLQKNFTNVKYFRYVKREFLIDAYCSSHLSVVPSRFEEFSLVTLESQAAGTPVVASETSGPRETVINDVTGKLVRVSNMPDLLQAVTSFKEMWYKKLNEYFSFSDNARQNSLRYDWMTISKRIDNLLNVITASK
jgi:glycosyltransferase involved in cell wall biosynthesis